MYTSTEYVKEINQNKSVYFLAVENFVENTGVVYVIVSVFHGEAERCSRGKLSQGWWRLQGCSSEEGVGIR